MMKRMGEMSEVAAAVTFLFSKDAEYVNGEIEKLHDFDQPFALSATDLKVDGGYGAMSAEGHGEKSAFGGVEEQEAQNKGK